MRMFQELACLLGFHGRVRIRHISKDWVCPDCGVAQKLPSELTELSGTFLKVHQRATEREQARAEARIEMQNERVVNFKQRRKAK